MGSHGVLSESRNPRLSWRGPLAENPPRRLTAALPSRPFAGPAEALRYAASASPSNT